VAVKFFEYIIFFLILSILGLYIIFDNSEKSCKIYNSQFKNELAHIKSNIDGSFYEMKNTAKIPYPWITARVDINRSNDAWENDVISLMKKNGWKNHPREAKNLCKDGSKLILEQVVYGSKTYQFISLLHDDTTEDDCTFYDSTSQSPP